MNAPVVAIAATRYRYGLKLASRSGPAMSLKMWGLPSTRFIFGSGILLWIQTSSSPSSTATGRMIR